MTTKHECGIQATPDKVSWCIKKLITGNDYELISEHINKPTRKLKKDEKLYRVETYLRLRSPDGITEPTEMTSDELLAALQTPTEEAL